MEPVFIGFFAALAAFLIVAARRGHRIRLMEEADRQRVLRGNSPQARERRQRELHEQYLEIHREARERARIALPELLDIDEARKFALDRNPDADALIAEALDLASSNASLASREERETLELRGFFNAQLQYAFEDEMAELDFGAPARVVDCGEAGSIELFTMAQAQKAGEEAGIAEYVRARAEAADVARLILRREREQREAEEAHIASVTTRLEDLPPLPAKEN